MPSQAEFIREAWLRIRDNIIYGLLTLMTILIISSLVFFVTNQREIDRIQEQNVQIRSLRNHFSALRGYINFSDMGVRGYGTYPNEKILNPHKGALSQYQIALDELKQEVENLELENSGYEEAAWAIRSFFENNEAVVQQMLEGNFDPVRELVRENTAGKRLFSVFSPYEKHISEQAKALEEKNTTIYNKAKKYNILLQVTLLLITLPTMGFVLYRLRRNETRRKELFSELSRSQDDYLFNAGRHHLKEETEKQLIGQMVQNLSKARTFIQQIGAGNYQAEWEGMTVELQARNSETLAGELIKMRDTLQRIKQEDQLRNWTNEGINKIAEVVRRHQTNAKDLSHDVLTLMVKYLQLSLGGLFVVRNTPDKGTLLELSACFAYERQKFLEGKILPGEGLIGAAFLEKQTIHLKKIPKNYIFVGSGLGHAPPTELLIVPMVFNEQVEGVLELASFHPLAPHQIALAEQMGGIIASTLFSMKSIMENAQMLENAQKQQEEMRAQEEEMRQNVEELKATQEENRRRQAETEAILYAVNNSIAMIEFTIDGIIVKANEQFLSAMGYQADEIAGRHHRIFMPPGQDMTAEYQALWKNLAKGIPFAMLVKRKKKNGAIVTLNAHYNPILSESGKVQKVIKFAQVVAEA